jgi:hypothetical protein
LRITLIQGVEWNTLINKYMNTIPVNGDECPEEQSKL